MWVGSFRKDTILDVNHPRICLFSKAMLPYLIFLICVLLGVWRIKELVKTTSHAQVFQAHGRQTGFLQKINVFNIFVCQNYCGVWYVSFTLFPEFSAFAFRNFSRYLEFFVLEDVYLRVFFIQESPDASRKGGHCVSCVVWIVLFRCSYMKIAQRPVQLFWGDFHDLLFFGHFWNAFIS